MKIFFRHLALIVFKTPSHIQTAGYYEILCLHEGLASFHHFLYTHSAFNVSLYNKTPKEAPLATIHYQDKPWLAFYEKGVPEKIDYEKVCLPEFLERSASEFPDNMALLFQGYQVNYRKMKSMVDRCAAGLSKLGIKKGDSVAILLPNLIPCVISYYAILKIGAIVVMNNPLYSDRELKHQFNDSGSKLLITLDLLADRMIDLRPSTGIRHIIYTSIGDYLPFPKNLLFPLVAKKKGLAADVKPAENVLKWKSLNPQEFNKIYRSVYWYWSKRPW